MKRNPIQQRDYSAIFFSVLAWSAVMLLFVIVRFYGIDEEALVEIKGDRNDLLELILWEGLSLGLMLGIALSLIDAVIDRRVLTRMSYLQLIALRTVAHIILTIPILGVSLFLSHKLMGYEAHTNWQSIFLASPFSRSVAVLLLYTGFFSALFNILRQISSMFGPGILLKLITGRYHHPKEEQRIFLFLDLRSSTLYAEQLGHVLYSELIQDCFIDLTPAIQKYQAEVYQYVGDEAVLTWKLKEGLKDRRCLHAYFRFDEAIQSRREYYQTKYNLVPEFKAGANCGPVMAAEVGVIKREIAYHSDVLNTAARIQSRCNELGEPLLISEDLASLVSGDPAFNITEAGQFQLRGKRNNSTLFGVRKF